MRRQSNFSQLKKQENTPVKKKLMRWNKQFTKELNNLSYADDTTLMAQSEEELKSPLMKVKEESEKGGWKLNIQKTKIMASASIIIWQIYGETVTDLLFWAPKWLQMVTAAMTLKDTCSLEEKLWPT